MGVGAPPRGDGTALSFRPQQCVNVSFCVCALRTERCPVGQCCGQWPPLLGTWASGKIHTCALAHDRCVRAPISGTMSAQGSSRSLPMSDSHRIMLDMRQAYMRSASAFANARRPTSHLGRTGCAHIPAAARASIIGRMSAFATRGVRPIRLARHMPSVGLVSGGRLPGVIVDGLWQRVSAPSARMAERLDLEAPRRKRGAACAGVVQGCSPPSSCLANQGCIVSLGDSGGSRHR